MARPARPISAATRVATQAARAADSRCAHHGALHSLARQILWACSREAPFRPRGRALRPLGLIPWQLAAIRLASGRKTAVRVRPRRRLTASAWKSWQSCIGRSACRAAYTEARSAGPRCRSCPAPVPSRGPSCRSWFGVSDRRPLREDAWRSRGGRSMQPDAMLSNRRSIGERANGSLRGSWSMAHVLGGGHARGLQSWR